MDVEILPSTFHSLQEVSRNVAVRLGWDEEQKRWDMIRLWQETFGDPVAGVSYPLSLQSDEIVIACKSALWKRELTYLLPEIRARLNETDAAPQKYFISGGPPLSPSRQTLRPLRHSLTRPDRAALDSGRRHCLILPDPLRTRAQAFVFRQMVTGIHLEHKKPL